MLDGNYIEWVQRPSSNCFSILYFQVPVLEAVLAVQAVLAAVQAILAAIRSEAAAAAVWRKRPSSNRHRRSFSCAAAVAVGGGAKINSERNRVSCFFFSKLTWFFGLELFWRTCWGFLSDLWNSDLDGDLRAMWLFCSEKFEHCDMIHWNWKETGDLVMLNV